MTVAIPTSDNTANVNISDLLAVFPAAGGNPVSQAVSDVVGSGSSSLGVLLRQTGETDKGLFLSAFGIGLDGHGVGQSSGTVTPASGSHVDLPNNGGGVGVGRHGNLRLHFPADITGFAGANSNNIVVRLNRLDAVAASPVTAWNANTGVFTLTVGATTSFTTASEAIANFSTFTITTTRTGRADGSDVFQLGADATGANYSATGGHDERPAQVELLAEPDEDPPRILVKYDLTLHTTLQHIHDELVVNDQGVTITIPHGTDLTAAPEAVPWDRGIDAGLGGGGEPSTSLDDLPIPLWASGNDYAAGELVRDGHNRAFLCISSITSSSNAPATDATHFLSVTSYAGDYADRIAYPRGEIVSHSNEYYIVGTAVGATNTDDPTANNSFVHISGSGSGFTGVTVQDEGTALSTAATALNFTGTGVTATGAGATKTINIPGATGGSSNFDLHDDVSTAATEINADGLDRFLISQEDETGDPNAYITSENARKFFKGYVGDWSATPAGFVFRVGDVTEYNDQWYVCRAENTKPANGPDTDPTHWEPITSFAGAWTAGNWWHQGTLVTYDTHVWLAISDVIDTDSAPGSSSKWVQIDGGLGTSPNPVVLYSDTTAPTHPQDSWRAVTLSRVPQTSSQISIRLTAGNDRGTVGLVEFPAREWLDLPVIDNTGSSSDAGDPANTLSTGERVLGMVLTQVGDTSIEAINTRNIVLCRYSDTSMGMWHTTGGSDNSLVRIIEFPNAGQTVDVSAARTDTLVFYSPTSGHAAFDALDFGSTVTYVYGTSETDATVLSASRSGTVCTLVLEKSDGWATAFSQATFEFQDSADTSIATLTVTARADARADVDSPGEWYSDLEAITGGEEVWRDLSRIDAADNTHLSLGTRTATTVPISSSTGDSVTLPAATATEAGVESAADKTQLTALPPTWAGARVWPAGSHCAYQGATYRASTQREITDTDPPTSDAEWVDVGDSSGTANLSVARTATQVTVESDTGTNAVIGEATTAVAGALGASNFEKLEASINKWVAGIYDVGDQVVWDGTGYECVVARTAADTDNPATDTTGWKILGVTPDLSGYVEDSDIANFQTATEITTEITNAVADRLIDGGAYDSTDAYVAGTVVRHNSATYLSLIAVGANTESTTEPGVGSAWETSWFRVGFEDGPPNAFISAALSGDNLTFTREGGTNPLSVDIGGVSGGSTLRVESIGLLSTASDVAVPARDWVQLTDFDTDAVVTYGAGDPEIVTRDATDDGELTLVPGVYEFVITGYASLAGVNDERGAPVFQFREAGGSEVYAQSDMGYIRSTTSGRTINYDSTGDGTLDERAAPFEVRMRWVQSVERAVDVYIGSDPWAAGLTVATAAGDDYTVFAESLRFSILRPGSGNPVVINTFDPQDIGTDTFDLTGSATQVALTDDTSGEAIVIPDSGYILTITTVSGLGLRGQVQLHLAEDLQNATMESGLQAQFYTNSDNELIFGAAAQTGGTATTNNKIIVQRVGSTTESSSGSTPVINPSILRFDVTGENHPSVASIAGDVFDVIGEISQSGHVGSADIVGFAGTAHDPITVSTLLSDTQIQAAGGYHHFTGRLTIPVGTSLANVNDIYTIRLRVWPTGGDTSVAPTIYHDYRITRVAAAAETRFGHLPFFRSDGSTHTDASDLTAFDDDTTFSKAGSAIGDWTITGLEEGDGERRLYWAVPATDTQPAVWLNSGTDVTDIIDVPSAAQDIGTPAVSYRVYVSNTQFDDYANGTVYTTRSS